MGSSGQDKMSVMKTYQRSWKAAMLLALFVWCGEALAVSDSSSALRYARLYERELGGEKAGLVQDYRALYVLAQNIDKELAEKALNRIGVCEKKAGRLEQARAAWRELVEKFPLSDPVVASARESLKALEWEMDRIFIAGRVMALSRSGKEEDRGSCFVFAGDWGNEPPALTSMDGGFRMGRRAVGQLPDGQSYGLIFAEHASLPLVGADVWVGSGATGMTVSLAAPMGLIGKVVDRFGNPITGTRIRFTGFKLAPTNTLGGEFGITNQLSDFVPLPIDRIIPPVFSGANGIFVIEGVPSRLRYNVTAENPEYRVAVSEVISDQGSRNQGFGQLNVLTNLQISNLFADIIWLRGNPESGSPVGWEELHGRVVVLHYGSAYGEASLRAQYSDEVGGLSRLKELYGDGAVMCMWILPAGEERGEAAQLALGLYSDMPVGGILASNISPLMPHGMTQNVVLGRDGRVVTICSDQQVFSAVKRAAAVQ